jgi:colanic acid/amylovoran biosynthesis glycosyltransferase
VELLQDPELRLQLATQARKIVEQDFDIHRNAAQLRTLFRTAAVSPVAV